MKAGIATLTVALLIVGAPASNAALTTPEMVEMILDHIRGDANNPCVVIDQGSRPTPIGEAPDVVYWYDATGAYLYVVVYYGGGTVTAHASTACLNSL